jgi:hypothetical protein
MNGSSYIVKATYGAETRKWKSNSQGNHSGLVSEIINEFGIEAEKLHLKYKDSDGDLVELSSNKDLELAIELEKALNIVVIADLEDLHEKKSDVAQTRDSVSSPTKTEPIIDPATLEEVQLNETIQEKKPPTYSEVQSFSTKPTQFAGQNGYPSYQQQLPPFSRSQQMGSSPLPPTGNYGQQQVPQLNHAQQLSSTLPSAHPGNYGQQQFQPTSGYAQPPIGNYGQQQIPQMNHVQQPNQTLPSTSSSNYGQQQFQQPNSTLPPAQPNSYGQPQQQQFQPPQQATQPPVYAPVKLTPGWNAPPSTFFK